MKIKVRAGFQVKHGGKMYTGGQTFEASAAEARQWLDAGLVVETKAVSGSKNKAVTSEETPNKSNVLKTINRPAMVRKTTRKTLGGKR